MSSSLWYVHFGVASRQSLPSPPTPYSSHKREGIYTITWLAKSEKQASSFPGFSKTSLLFILFTGLCIPLDLYFTLGGKKLYICTTACLCVNGGVHFFVRYRKGVLYVSDLTVMLHHYHNTEWPEWVSECVSTPWCCLQSLTHWISKAFSHDYTFFFTDISTSRYFKWPILQWLQSFRNTNNCRSNENITMHLRSLIMTPNIASFTVHKLRVWIIFKCTQLYPLFHIIWEYNHEPREKRDPVG